MDKTFKKHVSSDTCFCKSSQKTYYLGETKMLPVLHLSLLYWNAFKLNNVVTPPSFEIILSPTTILQIEVRQFLLIVQQVENVVCLAWESCLTGPYISSYLNWKMSLAFDQSQMQSTPSLDLENDLQNKMCQKYYLVKDSLIFILVCAYYFPSSHEVMFVEVISNVIK